MTGDVQASSLHLALEALAGRSREGWRMRGNWTPRGASPRLVIAVVRDDVGADQRRSTSIQPFTGSTTKATYAAQVRAQP